MGLERESGLLESFSTRGPSAYVQDVDTSVAELSVGLIQLCSGVVHGLMDGTQWPRARLTQASWAVPVRLSIRTLLAGLQDSWMAAQIPRQKNDSLGPEWFV